MALLSAFADEIHEDFDVQLEHLNAHGVDHIELRRADGVGVLNLSDDQLRDIVTRATDSGVGFSAVGSPVGKWPLGDPQEADLDRMRRAIDVAGTIGCRYIRIFACRLPERAAPAEHRGEVLDRVGRLVELAEAAGLTAALENERGTYGDTGGRLVDVLKTLNSPALVGVFDPANFVQCDERPYKDCWVRAKPYIGYFHIKDARLGSGQVVPAGDGDGDVAMILEEAFKEGYDGFLSIEPHMTRGKDERIAFGAQKFSLAVKALKRVLNEIGA